MAWQGGAALAKALQSQIKLPPDEMPCGKLLAPDILILRRDPQGFQQPVLQQFPERQMQGYADRGLAPGLRKCGLQILQPHRDAPGNAGAPGQIRLPELKPGARVPSPGQHPQLDILAPHFSAPSYLAIPAHSRINNPIRIDFFFFTGFNPRDAINLQNPSTQQKSDIQDILKKDNCHEWNCNPLVLAGRNMLIPKNL
ncbi:hypothetical protein MI467_19190 [Delftia acidovorans]|uniref:hypothetical protein n=1 Tax=Delftia acidovorans TaxID=80866 RepID=UPI001EFE2EAC|nr:hypothetical protein [Delftia acidovorans]MCG8988961.1 hypothetical protein [Delftia acidovorans]